MINNVKLTIQTSDHIYPGVDAFWDFKHLTPLSHQ